MQHLGAAGGDLLRFVVVQRPDQARRRRGARIGAEHAGDVGPDFDGARTDLGGQVRRRRVRATAAQQTGVAVTVAGDETLGDDHGCGCVELLLQRRIGRKGTGGRQHRGLRRCTTVFRGQHVAGIHPGDVDALRLEEAGTDFGGHELAIGHDAGPRAVRQLAHQRDTVRHLLQLVEIALELRAHGNAQLVSQLPVPIFDRLEWFVGFARDRRGQQFFEPIGDLGDGRVDDQHAVAGFETTLDDQRDVAPVGKRRNAGAAELDDNPARR